MSLASFRVENQKALRLAECLHVPSLMIICGANGSGKSTLLWALKQQQGVTLSGNTQSLYHGPHRAIRRSVIQRRHVGGAPTYYADSLAADSVAAPEGISIPYPSRSPDNIDESGTTIKHSLAKLENKRQTFITQLYDKAVKGGEAQLDIQNVKSIFAPLADVVSRLLPHLTFERIDFTQEDNILVAFSRPGENGAVVTLDLDDLSSGEKAVILLFLPLVEAEIRANLETYSPEALSVAPESPDLLFLLDEPELHLHPDLQRRMLAYMRERSSRNEIQFVMITHSPTILDEASDEELYVLAPARNGENQLRQAATPSERLEALRELTGESYFLSTGRNIVCCEGEADDVKGKASDRSLIELFSTRSSRYTFVPMGGKSQVISAVKRLKESLPIDKYGVAVVGLLDSDQATTLPPDCIGWPFCEIENALLRPQLIADALNESIEGLGATATGVERLLSDSGVALRDEEIAIRIARELGGKMFRAKGSDVAAVRKSVDDFIADLQAHTSGSKINDICARVTSEVDAQLDDQTFVQRFRGKRLLRLVFNGLAIPNLSYERFSYLVAGRVRSDVEAAQQLDTVFANLDAKVDEQLATLLAPLDEPAVEGDMATES